jgi:ABC-type Fe3+ transport system substrate-binding protein
MNFPFICGNISATHVEYIFLRVGDSKAFEVMTSTDEKEQRANNDLHSTTEKKDIANDDTYLIGSLGSATLYQGNRDKNHKLGYIVSTEKYIW